MDDVIAILFDIDGTLITSGGAGATSWRRAFEELYGIPTDIGEFSDAGMTDPEVGRLTRIPMPTSPARTSPTTTAGCTSS